ncbi:MAG: TIGR04551 family protein [Myxococcales bacterium]|nr:TIGR04551 family protein [Myxococcales bacterium]MCB9700763.1 TIGR04551 family protein [Myxococcales bacterium]
MPGGPAQPGGGGKDKKEGPAEAAPKDKQALQPIDPVPAQPRTLRRLQLFELHGYMRTRGDYFHRLDMGLGTGQSTGSAADAVAIDNKFTPPPSNYGETIDGADSLVASDGDCLAGLTANGVNATKAARRCGRRNGNASANMRLRLEPTLHVTDMVKVHSQIDVLDNVVLGSTPDSYLGENPWAPIDLYTRTQTPPSDGRNSFSDSIVVKRAYGEIQFGWGLNLKFGRMPHHWGMGIVANDGNGYYRGDHGDIVRMLDMDYGDSVDSVRLGVDFGKDRRRTHRLEASWDWAASGPTTAQLLGPKWASGNNVGQDFSVEKFDNVYQWRLSIVRRDDPSMLRRKLSLGTPVVNYGAIAWLRYQSLDRVTGSPGLGDGLGTNPTWTDDNPDDGLGRHGSALGNGDADAAGDSGIQNYANLLIHRKALVVTPDIWLRVNWRTLRVELEAAGVVGRFNERDLTSVPTDGLQTIGDEDLSRVKIRQFGYALELKYGLYKDRFHLGFDQGFASGDDAGGTNRNAMSPLSIGGNEYQSAFRFNPAYMQDLLLFREALGTVSNAAYFRPWAAFYFLQNNMSARLDVQYAIAHQRQATFGHKYSWGLEIDAGLRYHDTREPIFVQLQYGALFPFGAFDRPASIYPAQNGNAVGNNGDAKAVQTIQGSVGIRF